MKFKYLIFVNDTFSVFGDVEYSGYKAKKYLGRHKKFNFNKTNFFTSRSH